MSTRRGTTYTTAAATLALLAFLAGSPTAEEPRVHGPWVPTSLDSALRDRFGGEWTLAAVRAEIDVVERAALRDLREAASEIRPGADWRDVAAEVAAEGRLESTAAVWRCTAEEIARAAAFVREHGLVDLTDDAEEVPFEWRAEEGVSPFGTYRHAGAYTLPDPGDDPAKVAEFLGRHHRLWTRLYVVHEIVPGHHLQHRYFARHAPDAHEDMAVVEGWAVYAERLMARRGYLEGDPRLRLVAAQMSLWRAVRARVDLALQAGEIAPDAAAEALEAGIGYDSGAAGLEADRLVRSPGSGVNYLVGAAEIEILRTRAAAALGGAFDERTFHNLVLAAPPTSLDSLRDAVAAWVDSRGDCALARSR